MKTYNRTMEKAIKVATGVSRRRLRIDNIARIKEMVKSEEIYEIVECGRTDGIYFIFIN